MINLVIVKCGMISLCLTDQLFNSYIKDLLTTDKLKFCQTFTTSNKYKANSALDVCA